MAKCGHVGCGKEMGIECHGHLCPYLYRSRLSCEELSKLLYEWALAHPDKALKALADSGISWAIQQRSEQQQTDSPNLPQPIIKGY